MVLSISPVIQVLTYSTMISPSPSSATYYPPKIRRRKMGNLNLNLWSMIWCLSLLHRSWNMNPGVDAQQQQQQQASSALFYSLDALPLCSLQTRELALLNSTQSLDPCILWNINPQYDDDDDDGSSTIPTVTLLQITPTHCGNHRDGAKTSVDFINQGKGIPLGYAKTVGISIRKTHVKFRLISIVGGNPSAMTSTEAYQLQHQQLLHDLLNETQAPYVIGTCSAYASIEPMIAQQYSALYMAQVGFPEFYKPYQDQISSYIFGIHLNSNEYTFASVQTLVTTSTLSSSFSLNQIPVNSGGSAVPISVEQRKQKLPIRIFQSVETEFYTQTCQAAELKAEQLGFQVVDMTTYNYTEILTEQQQKQTLYRYADEICPPAPSGSDNNNNNNGTIIIPPAIYICASTEHEILLERWLETGCMPTSLWMTASNLESSWVDNNPQQLPFVQGGGQWHQAMDYEDDFFREGGGGALLELNNELFGYYGTYDQVVSYSIPSLFQQQLQLAYSAVETSEVNIAQDFATAEGRERLRRMMVVVNADTLFGPVLFDQVTQRNIGRSPAGTQWLPNRELDAITLTPEDLNELSPFGDGVHEFLSSVKPITMIYDPNTTYVNRLVSPQLQAEATIVLSTENNVCPPGEYYNQTSWEDRGAVLLGGCRECPVDTTSSKPSVGITECAPCPDGSHTDGKTGATYCIIVDDNLIPPGILRFGYSAVSISWATSIFFMGWIYTNRKHTVVNIGQPRFLFLICVGAITSTSTIIAIGYQAGTDEDTTAASIGCTVAPFTYTIGWILVYSSLGAKTYRLYRVMKNNRNQDTSLPRKIVTFRSVLVIVVVALAVDMAIVLSLTFVNPLVYEREVIGEEIDLENDTVTIESIGRCQLSDDERASFWAWLAPLICFHLGLVIACIVLLLKVRKFSSRYQEFKYIALAMLMMLQFMLIGIPVLYAVQETPKVVHLIITIGITGHDILILCFMFIPKIYYSKKKSNEDHGEAIILASFQSMGRTQWDDSLDLINKLVAPGSKTRKAMSDDEVMRLEEVKALLIQGLQGSASKHDKLGHLPSNLAGKISIKAASESMRQPSTLRTDDSEIQYILKEFAGLNTHVRDRIVESVRSCDSETLFEEEALIDYSLPEFESLKKEDQEQVCEMLSWNNLKKWDFNIFELTKLTGGNPLLFIGWAILGSPYSQYSMVRAIGREEDLVLYEMPGYSFMDSSLRIPMKKLCDYIREIQDDYISSNPYHNDIHAADVVQSLNVLIQMMLDCEYFQISTDQLFSVLLAAVVHDVNHPGKNNSFQVNAKTGLALLYNNASVLENRHAAHAFMKMLGKSDLTGNEEKDNLDRNDDINPLCNLSPTKFNLIRGMIIGTVLHTDMSTHFQSVTAMKGLVMNEGAKTLSNDGIWKTLQFMLHLADISNPAKPEPLFRLWTDRCLNEFFAQGDKEREMGLPISPNCDRNSTKRAESQIGFIRYVILPAYEVLGAMIPKVESTILPVIRSNLVFWELDAVREKKLGQIREESANRRMTVELDPSENAEVLSEASMHLETNNSSIAVGENNKEKSISFKSNGGTAPSNDENGVQVSSDDGSEVVAA